MLHFARFTPENHSRRTCEKTKTTTPVLLQSTRNAFKTGSPNPLKLQGNPSLDPRMSFPLLLWPTRAPPRCEVIPQGPKLEPPGLPTGSFGHQKSTRPLWKRQLFEINELKTIIQKSASQHRFQQMNLAELKSDNKTPISQQAIKPIRIECKASQSAYQPATVNKEAGAKGEALT